MMFWQGLSFQLRQFVGVHVRLWGVHFHCRFSLPESSIDSAVIRHPFHPQLSLKLDGPLTQVVDTLERLEFYLSQKVPIFKLSTIYSHFFGYWISTGNPMSPQYIVYSKCMSFHIDSQTADPRYCWWKKSQTTSWEVYNPTNNGINYQPQLVNAGFLPSTVVPPSMSPSRQLSSLWGRSAVLTSPPTSCWATARRGYRDFPFFRWSKGSTSENSQCHPKIPVGCFVEGMEYQCRVFFFFRAFEGGLAIGSPMMVVFGETYRSPPWSPCCFSLCVLVIRSQAGKVMTLRCYGFQKLKWRI